MPHAAWHSAPPPKQPAGLTMTKTNHSSSRNTCTTPFLLVLLVVGAVWAAKTATTNPATATSDPLDAIFARLDAMDKKFDQKFTAMDQKFDQKFTAIDQKFDQKFTAMDQKFTAMDQKFDQKFTAIDQKFADMDKHMAGNFTQLSSFLLGNISALGASIHNIGNDKTELLDRISSKAFVKGAGGGTIHYVTIFGDSPSSPALVAGITAAHMVGGASTARTRICTDSQYDYDFAVVLSCPPAGKSVLNITASHTNIVLGDEVLAFGFGQEGQSLWKGAIAALQRPIHALSVQETTRTGGNCPNQQTNPGQCAWPAVPTLGPNGVDIAEEWSIKTVNNYCDAKNITTVCKGLYPDCAARCQINPNLFCCSRGVLGGSLTTTSYQVQGMSGAAVVNGCGYVGVVTSVGNSAAVNLGHASVFGYNEIMGCLNAHKSELPELSSCHGSAALKFDDLVTSAKYFGCDQRAKAGLNRNHP